MADKLTPKIGDMVFDYEWGALTLVRTYTHSDGTLMAVMSEYDGDIATERMELIVKLDLIDAWLEAHECDDDEYEGSGTARQQAYRYLSHNGFDGTCACCGVDFTEYMP